MARPVRLSPRRSKYGNRKTTVDGITFDSAKEARRFQDLRLLSMAGEITGLIPQYPLPLIVNGELIAKYYADFRYTENGAEVFEDVKGVRTPVYRLKKKLVRALYGLEIRET